MARRQRMAAGPVGAGVLVSDNSIRQRMPGVVMVGASPYIPVTTLDANTILGGVSVDSVLSDATFTGYTGIWSADYPVTNLADTISPSKVARVSPADGEAAFEIAFSQDQTLSFLALINHGLTADAVMQVKVFDASDVVLFDSGARAIPEPVAGYIQTRPLFFTEVTTARKVRVEMFGVDGDLDIGACEVSRFWSWPNITTGADAGVRTSGEGIDLVGGGSLGPEGSKARTYNGQASYMDLSVSTTTGLDFQKLTALSKPFVFVEDPTDPTSWPRGCFQARNADLPPMVSVLYDADHFQFRLVEHRR